MEHENEVVIVTNVYGDVCIRKARRKRQKLLVKELLHDYASKTTLHGIPYLTKLGLTGIEKMFWLITTMISIAMCLYLIRMVWYKWQTSPVIVSVSERLVPVSLVPFPSVTICPQSKCKVSVYNFTNEKAKLDDFFLKLQYNETINATMKEQITKFDGISRVCRLFHSYNLSQIYPHNYADSSVVQHILEVAPDYSDVFVYCKINGKDSACGDMFDKVVTGEGICYTMNSLAASQIFRSRKLQKDYKYLYAEKPNKRWSLEHGYDYDSMENLTFYPIPGSENGGSPDVEVVLQDFRERDKLCNFINTGFKVYMQHPADLPHSSLYYYAVINAHVSSMALSFSVLNTSESVRNYDPEIRQCYFPDERYLKYFNLYTANNCGIECLSNITYKMCGCVAFSMPHSSSNRICTEKHALCIGKAREKMRLEESMPGKSKCHCLPSCDSVDYEAEILKTEFKLKQFIKNLIGSSDDADTYLNKVGFSKLEMYFKRPRYLSMRRSELFGVIEFLSYCGGLLGLFLGFSFLSLVEIFYFLTLRLCCTLKKDLEAEKLQELEQGKEINLEKY